jgi:hypothetical protein
MACSTVKCKRLYDKDDMFYDFKGSYYLCPRCLARDYNHYYQQAVKLDQELDEVKLETGEEYPFQDLVHFFKQWCISCANRIGEADALEMRKGARICMSCVSLNIDNMVNMIKCLSCEGYVHTEKEIYKRVGS